MSAERSPDLMVPLMVQSEGFGKHIKSFITLVMRKMDLDGHKESSNWGGGAS